MKTQEPLNPSTYKFGGKEYSGYKLSWLQLNERTRAAKENDNIMVYLGSDMDPKGQIFCGFQEYKKEDKENGYKKGSIFFVDNDVVFDFQATGNPVKTRGVMADEYEELDEDDGSVIDDAALLKA